ncbi:hypothetical protein HanRHA438_Chr17g0790031 [Helianthus annuus]|nr:hypothetical protein HanRHA438_Chr17g0790031 [Helianthus annuus]
MIFQLPKTIKLSFFIQNSPNHFTPSKFELLVELNSDSFFLFLLMTIKISLLL